jgi:hypothetical protein
MINTAMLVQETESNMSIWQDYVSVSFDPAHILAELTFTIVFDFVLLWLGYKIFFKGYILPRLRRDIHRDIDVEHGYVHAQDEYDNDPELQNLLKRAMEEDDSLF